jgi:hypothetical protein
MKNTRLLATGLLVFLTAAAWSQTFESETAVWQSVFFEWANFFDYTKDGGDTFTEYTGSPGVSIAFHSFIKQRNLDGSGSSRFNLFTRASVLFPAVYSSRENGSKTGDRRGDFDTMTQLNLMMGPAFQFNPNEKMVLYLGPGLELLYTAIDITNRDKLAAFLDVPGGIGTLSKGSASSLKLGLGVDLGFKFNFTVGSWPRSSLSLTAGTVLDWYFLGSTRYEAEVSLAGETYIIGVDKEPRLGDQFGFGVRPYIGISVNSWGKTESRRGTAPRDNDG